jgi:hypothetical protein
MDPHRVVRVEAGDERPAEDRAARREGPAGHVPLGREAAPLLDIAGRAYGAAQDYGRRGRPAGRDGSGAEVVPFPGAEPPAERLDFDDDEFLDQWAEVDRGAVALVREALADVLAADPPQEALAVADTAVRAGVATRRWPHLHVAAAAGWRGNVLTDDVELWVSAAGAFVTMTDESGMAEEEAPLMALEHADWVGAVVGLVRAGVGSRAEPADLVGYVDATP